MRECYSTPWQTREQLPVGNDQCSLFLRAGLILTAPMPELAPVIRTVLPIRRDELNTDMFRVVIDRKKVGFDRPAG